MHRGIKTVMGTGHGTITINTSKNMSSKEDNCLEFSKIESISDNNFTTRGGAKNVIREFTTNIRA